jgi:hypothetical protein
MPPYAILRLSMRLLAALPRTHPIAAHLPFVPPYFVVPRLDRYRVHLHARVWVQGVFCAGVWPGVGVFLSAVAAGHPTPATRAVPVCVRIGNQVVFNIDPLQVGCGTGLPPPPPPVPLSPRVLALCCW